MNHEIKYPREYTEELRVLEAEDRGHADIFNSLNKALINNDAYLKYHADQAGRHQADPDIHVTAEQKSVWDRKAESTEASGEAAGLMSTADKAKLDGIEAGAEANQEALGSIKAGNVVVRAGGTSAQVELAAGTNISITGDNATKKVTISGPSSLPNPQPLAIQINGTTVASYGGSEAQTVNLTPAGLGAVSLVIREEAPEGSSALLWIGADGVMHYWSGTAWEPVRAVWG